ncbi:MAG: hypothetical protein K0R57_6151 [Paenibacillaceae bacterium]|jgi:tetratricopeptide (TPR) repeat protein|nr:hypothetical protein [Paenibacillaceae bacterium]
MSQLAEKVTVTVETVELATYAEPPCEELPMFAENRVHQRTSGNPYPSKIVLKVNREKRELREHTLIKLENEFLEIGILPELGGRIFSARDKVNQYDFFYKQSVIKPALIGALGSWISGGLEFNWPYHHRPSTFMPVDYHIEKTPDGSAIVWLSEHDPAERMKGMVGIVLHPGEAVFETRVRLYNPTEVRRSFLWWENAAVPVNKSYQIFFPPDVSHVNFHYKRSVTTYPVAAKETGPYNGIRLEQDTDISLHRNTVQPTSYFSAASQYDFFGGYDHDRQCGVVHVANHHISPGKKLFTWAYNQLSQSWEKALTDTDGEYAELMAGCYSDNQPDFAWLEPQETKSFSQYWYPIGSLDTPCFANVNGAISISGSRLRVQTTRALEQAGVQIFRHGQLVYEAVAELHPGIPHSFDCPEDIANGSHIKISCRGVILMEVELADPRATLLPEPLAPLPNPKEVPQALQLYLQGVHVWQYRDPAASPVCYWQEALRRDPEFAPALLALAEYYYKSAFFDQALKAAEQALDILTRYNSRLEDGKAYYLLGLIHAEQKQYGKAYDFFYKASWSQAYLSASMRALAKLDGRRGDHVAMLAHCNEALRNNADNSAAAFLKGLALLRSGAVAEAAGVAAAMLGKDPLDHTARYLLLRSGVMAEAEFVSAMRSDPSQTCLDLAVLLLDAGLAEEAAEALETLCRHYGEPASMVYYALATLSQDGQALCRKAEVTPVGRTFPFRLRELDILQQVVEQYPDSPQACYLLGCLLYSKGHHEKARRLWLKPTGLEAADYAAYRNLAVASFSRLQHKEESLPLLRTALALQPGDEQLLYETVYVMAKLGVAPTERSAFLEEHLEHITRDDLVLELARAYNQAGEAEQALRLLLGHSFVPCEGGEHAVAEQYMYACHYRGREEWRKGRAEAALDYFRRAQALPSNLGAGLWHEAKLTPHQYYEAVCLDALGRGQEAMVLYSHIMRLTLDYFSNMHLPELPYYQALCQRRTGHELQGGMLIGRCLRQWRGELAVEDAGHFGTTPFFISYCDDPKTAREAYYSYLLGLGHAYLGEQDNARNYLAASCRLDPARLYNLLELQETGGERVWTV